ncbi:MAG TPA: HAD-IA family hydrolase, partial [Dongiaceae bacterium]|nr:HAD-IA family hydrolase [Dongiaceae bacterium]
YAQIRGQVSNGARALVKLGFNITEESDRFNDRLDMLLKLYEKELAQESRLFPGLNETLKMLEDHDIPWGVVTNKPSRYTIPLLKGLKLDQRCAAAVCPDHVDNKKPHPEPLLTACEWLSVDPRQTIYVGDHIRDIEAGRAAGNSTIAAAWGYLNPDEDISSWEADFILHTPQELHHLLATKLPG